MHQFGDRKQILKFEMTDLNKVIFIVSLALDFSLFLNPVYINLPLEILEPLYDFRP